MRSLHVHEITDLPGYRWELSWVRDDGEGTTIDCDDTEHALSEIRTILEGWDKEPTP